MSVGLPQKGVKSPSSVERFSPNGCLATRYTCELDAWLTGEGKVFHRIQKADRLNNTSLPKIMMPSGTVEGPRRSVGGCTLEAYAYVRGINPLTVRVTTSVVINALSAAGSRIEPRTEPMSYFRAK